MHEWEPTRHGGFRRTRVAQSPEERCSDSAEVGSRRGSPRTRVFTWRERLGLPECPYVIRWKLELPSGRSVRVHHWLRADDDRAFHDHPWWFATVVLKGGYDDVHPAPEPDGTWHDQLRAGSVRFRPALHRHTVVPGPRGAWTVIVTGPKVRPWGFWQDNRFFKANKWFARFGHHPCN